MQKQKGLFEIILKSILESPLYIPGEWEDPEIQSFEYNTRFDFIKKDAKIIYEQLVKIKNKNYNIFWLYDKNKEYIYIGFIYNDKENIERFKQIGYVQLKRNQVIEKIKPEYKPLYEISEIYFEKDFRKYGLGYLTYLIILTKLKFNIMSDEIQYTGPAKIYSKFSKSEYICADIVNIKTKKIIKENHCIYFNPKDDLDFDKLVWDLKDYNKMDVRIVLYIKD